MLYQTTKAALSAVFDTDGRDNFVVAAVVKTFNFPNPTTTPFEFISGHAPSASGSGKWSYNRTSAEALKAVLLVVRVQNFAKLLERLHL